VSFLIDQGGGPKPSALLHLRGPLDAIKESSNAHESEGSRPNHIAGIIPVLFVQRGGGAPSTTGRVKRQGRDGAGGRSSHMSGLAGLPELALRSVR
jgi:hypothetical protein